IKVEALEGDITRQIGPTRNAGMGPVFLNANRSKRSIALDLKQDTGRDVLLRLAKNADVLVYNVRPQAMARLRLSYDDVAAINPRIVYAGLFGFGQNGPYAAKAGLRRSPAGFVWPVASAGACRRRQAALRAHCVGRS